MLYNGAISYLVGGPVSRMLVGVSTLALRLGISTTAKQTLCNRAPELNL